MSKISQYAALTTALADDLALTVDVHDTSMAASGTDKKITLAALLTGSKIFNIVAYGADPTGVSNSTSAITSAKTAAGSKTRNIILVPPGTYLTDPFTFDGFHWLGFGPYSSILKANAGSLDFATNTGYIGGSGAGLPTDGSETNTVIEGLAFDGSALTGTNSANLYSASNAGGTGIPTVFAVGNGAPSGTFGAGIPTFIVRDCRVHDGPGVGVSTEFVRGGLPDCHFADVFTYNHGGNGWQWGSDQRLVDCVSENNTGSQFYCSGRSSFGLVGCKAYSGLGTGGHGFQLNGSAPGGIISAPQTQDNQGYGIYFNNAQGYMVEGAICDSNAGQGTGSPKQGAAVGFTTSTNNFISFSAIDRNYNGGGTAGNNQINAINIDTASTGNIIECAAFYKTAGSSTLAWFAAGSGNGTGNDIRFQNSRGITAPAFASTITPDPTLGQVWNIGALTGAITIAAPTTPWAGARLTIIFTQDGTGGRAVTWNAVFKFQTAWTNTGNTNGKQSSASFVYDGTNWVSTNPGVNVWF